MTRDRLFWAACGVGSALVVAGCLLPTIEVGQSAFVGAGETQRGFDYARTVHFATYGQPTALFFLLGGAALVALSTFALLRRSSAPVILAATTVSLVFVVGTIRIGDELQGAWAEGGVLACDQPLEDCVPVIAPATRNLQAEIRTRPEAQEPGFELLYENGYSARGKIGWSLIFWSSIGLAVLTLYRAFVLALRPIWAGVAVAVTALLVLVYEALKSLEGIA